MTQSITITLPWPDRALWQNARVHWAVIRSATRSHKERACFEAVWAGAKHLQITGRPRLVWTIHPPDKRRRDLPNAIAALKPAIDGIQDALGIDDTHFLNQWPEEFAEPVKDGKVIVTITSEGNGNES